MAATRKEKAEQTQAALKQAARGLFVERGYLNTKITDITAAAGRATGVFYDHFASKEALLQALLADMYAQGDTEIAARNLGCGDGAHNLVDRGHLRAHLAAGWAVMSANLPVVAALHAESAAAGPASGRAWQQLTEGTEALRDHLADLRDAGHALPGEPELVAAAMGTVLSSLAYALLPQPERAYSDDEVLDTLTDLLLRGIAGTGTGTAS
jgi:AcrR family transcriptional regulator